MTDILVVTTEAIPGYRITEVHGHIFGQTTRARNAFSKMGQGLKNMVGGEIKGYTKLQEDARDQAMARLQEKAAAISANAVVMFRFDTTSGDMGESVAAYGTAVTIEPID